jgi:hypothetical protein
MSHAIRGKPISLCLCLIASACSPKPAKQSTTSTESLAPSRPAGEVRTPSQTYLTDVVDEPLCPIDISDRLSKLSCLRDYLEGACRFRRSDYVIVLDRLAASALGSSDTPPCRIGGIANLMVELSVEEYYGLSVKISATTYWTPRRLSQDIMWPVCSGAVCGVERSTFW